MMLKRDFETASKEFIYSLCDLDIIIMYPCRAKICVDEEGRLDKD